MFSIYKTVLPYISLNKIQKINIEILKKKIASKKYKLIRTICPICNNHKEYETISKVDRFGIEVKNVICKKCGLIRNLKCLDSSSLKSFYNNEYRLIYTGKKSTNQKHLKNIFYAQFETGKKYYELINKIINIKKKNTVLEIGCSCGGVLSYFKDKGLKVTGLDYDNTYLKYGKKKKLNLIYGSLENLNKKKFDIIILSHVFEHIYEIKSFINNLNNFLAYDGIIFIAVPGIYNKNYYSIRHIKYNYKKILFLYYLQNAHIYSFSKKTLTNFFRFTVDNFRILYIDETINCIVSARNFKRNTKKKIKNDYKTFKFFYFINYIKYNLIKTIKGIYD